MKISILTENTVYKRGLLGEHGLSLLIETEGSRYLFDTGQSDVFLHNAAKLQLPLQELDGVILSHGHYDHCGGMEKLPQQKKEVPVYIQKKAFEKKYAENFKTGELRYIGLEKTERWPQWAKIHKLQGGCNEISAGVYLLSEIPYITEFEPLPKGFWKDSEQSYSPELLADTMEDEQLLVMESEAGLCVFAGCAHPGMINCLRHVQSVFPNAHIHSLVAGMHLKGCGIERVQKTILALQEMKIDHIIPLHCTGIRAIAAIREALGSCCILAEAGKQIEL
jgi:Metal-dependent hydrolases of the beta-lactamase superfamily II